MDNLPLVLVIAKNNDLFKLLESRLTICNVKGFTNGRAGIHAAFDFVPELIIAENIIPGVNGIKVCHAVKFDIRTKHIPFILLLNDKLDEYYSTGIEKGPNHIINWPYDFDDIHEQIKIYLEVTRNEKLKNSTLSLNHGLKLSGEDKDLLTSIESILEENYVDASFNVDEFSDLLFMSRMQLHRKVKELYGLSPGALIRQKRLNKAAHLLKTTEEQVSSISYDCGFTQPSYFAKSFKQLYGCSPGKYRM